jgi:hypothetical protein
VIITSARLSFLAGIEQILWSCEANTSRTQEEGPVGDNSSIDQPKVANSPKKSQAKSSRVENKAMSLDAELSF